MLHVQVAQEGIHTLSLSLSLSLLPIPIIIFIMLMCYLLSISLALSSSFLSVSGFVNCVLLPIMPKYMQILKISKICVIHKIPSCATCTCMLKLKIFQFSKCYCTKNVDLLSIAVIICLSCFYGNHVVMYLSMCIIHVCTSSVTTGRFHILIFFKEQPIRPTNNLVVCCEFHVLLPVVKN